MFCFVGSPCQPPLAGMTLGMSRFLDREGPQTESPESLDLPPWAKQGGLLGGLPRHTTEFGRACGLRAWRFEWALVGSSHAHLIPIASHRVLRFMACAFRILWRFWAFDAFSFLIRSFHSAGLWQRQAFHDLGLRRSTAAPATRAFTTPKSDVWQMFLDSICSLLLKPVTGGLRQLLAELPNLKYVLLPPPSPAST